MIKLLHKNLPLLLCLAICIAFFTAYSVLAIVKHSHYMSGYDLGINDQLIWRYSTFQPPLTTTDPFPDKLKLYEHVELIYILVAPFYWIWSTRYMLLLVRAAFICSGGVAVYLLAKKKKLRSSISLALVVSFLGFYGVQEAVWNDVHSVGFATPIIMWFIYFLETKRTKLSVLCFFLIITAKENLALLTFLASFVLYLRDRSRLLLWFMAGSVVYLIFIFTIYFPVILHQQYLYQNSDGLISNINPLSFVDTHEKLQVLWYSLLSYGFLPILGPLQLLPAIGDLVTYFIVASDLSGAQGLYGHYRITLTPFMVWATITGISKYKRLNVTWISFYLLVSVVLVQYILHLPLSYLTKTWFWQEPSGVQNINYIKNTVLPADASVVAQINIIPHITHRDQIYTLYPEKKTFVKNSPCGKPECNWFRWYGTPEYLFVDTSPEWNILQLLEQRDDFIDGLKNLEKAHIITKYVSKNSAVLYKVNKNPAD